jgi:hypothetical protein
MSARCCSRACWLSEMGEMADAGDGCVRAWTMSAAAAVMTSVEEAVGIGTNRRCRVRTRFRGLWV